MGCHVEGPGNREGNRRPERPCPGCLPVRHQSRGETVYPTPCSNKNRTQWWHDHIATYVAELMVLQMLYR